MIEHNKMKSENDEWDTRDFLKHLKFVSTKREKDIYF